MVAPIQRIIFGGPGTGKSYKIIKKILPSLQINDTKNHIHTVFHPDYTYGDFMGKLLPLTEKESVTYKFYKGDFLKALSQSFKNLLEAQINNTQVKHVALIIDEINRGNAPAIFGKIFQLLDRDDDWSTYRVDISQMEFNEFISASGIEYRKKSYINDRLVKWWFQDSEIKDTDIIDLLDNMQIKIPPNLSIIATMNTSDNTIFYMDSAFKRRWEWEFIDIKSTERDEAYIHIENSKYDWKTFVDKLNLFIEKSHEYVRDIDSKQIGYWFLKENIISEEQIKNKLMFFLWDSIFINSKKPLAKLLATNNDIITFSNFRQNTKKFIEEINKLNV